MLSCLTLAATCAGAAVTTVEGLAQGESLHPPQAALLEFTEKTDKVRILPPGSKAVQEPIKRKALTGIT